MSPTTPTIHVSTQTPRAVPLVLLLVLTGHVPTAHAWSSHCYVDAEARMCSDGLEKARHGWLSSRDLEPIDEPEHAQLFTTALSLSGVPATIGNPMTLSSASSGVPVLESGLPWFDGAFPSIDPVVEAPGLAVTRVTTIAEMAQLPDHSYTLWDWARGNEHCPPDAGMDVQDCHQFEGHMGGLNASHFPPQSQHYYAWYHALAIARAAECNVLATSLGEHAASLERYVLACEQEAMLIEAVGQHYLQDAWSSGHMWERWGGPRPMDFHSAPIASLIGAYAGTWHGAKAVMDPATGISWDDPMCAPAPTGDAVQYLDALTGETEDGVGDIFLDRLQDDPTYRAQHDALYACSIQGMRQVYSTTAQQHGLLGPATVVLDRPDPTGLECFGQRVTNASLDLGAIIHRGTAPGQVDITPRNYAPLIATMIKFAAPDAVEPTFTDMGMFRRDAAANRTQLTLAARRRPNETDIADGGLLPIAGSEQNSGHLNGVLGELARPPAPYLEPMLPWTLTGSDHARALALTFSEAHGGDICTSADPELIASLPLWAATTPPASDTEEAARLALCEQLTEPFLAVGWPDARLAGDLPLCEALGLAPLWSRHDNLDGLTREQALWDWCTTEPSLIRDGGFERDTGAWTTTHDADRETSVYAQTPASGMFMLKLQADPSAGETHAVASQDLSTASWTSGGSLAAGDYVLRFKQRTITHEDNHWVDLATCEANTVPWFVARIDSSDGNTILYESDPTDWCSTMVRLDGVHYAEPDWLDVEVPFTLAADTPAPHLTFQVGTSVPHRHIVLVDDVVLETAGD